MKSKKIMSMILLISIFTITGCSSSKTITCTRDSKISETMSMTSKFVVTYLKDEVKQVSSVEKLTSTEANYLEAYKTSVESTYAPYDGIDYYDYDIEIEDDTLITTVKINYDKIDLAKLIDADTSNSDLIKEGKVNYDNLIELYSSIGATCK